MTAKLSMMEKSMLVKTTGTAISAETQKGKSLLRENTRVLANPYTPLLHARKLERGPENCKPSSDDDGVSLAAACERGPEKEIGEGAIESASGGVSSVFEICDWLEKRRPSTGLGADPGRR
ncbi:MAG: uncharacterized protein A8A55_3265, partial [Amphiamblys sp. WSBS2006]